MQQLTVKAFVDEIERQGEALAGSAETAGLDAPVPTCPGWAVRDLLGHTGEVHRWAAAYVRDRLSRGQRPAPIAEVTGPDAVEDYRAANAALVRVLRNTPDDLDCFTLWPDPSPLRFWARRQAHETAVHAIDAAAAAHVDAPELDDAFAADGVDELLVGMLMQPKDPQTSPHPWILRFVTSRPARTWTLAVTPDGTTTADGAAGPQVADLSVSGTAPAVYRWVWNRCRTDDALEVAARDADVVSWWRREVRIGR